MILQGELFIILLSELIKRSTQSISGVTYMDDYDVREKYRDVHECDPLYWHPLHLPEHCSEMFEKLIRAKIAKTSPVRVMTNVQNNLMFYYMPGVEGYPLPVATVDVPDSSRYSFSEISDPFLWPHEKMLQMVRQDVANLPRAPTLEMVPNLGPAAVYRQPISKMSKDQIVKVAQQYGEAYLTQSDINAIHDSGYDVKYIADDKEVLPKDSPIEREMGVRPLRNNVRNNDKLMRKIIHKDNMIAAIETLRVR